MSKQSIKYIFIGDLVNKNMICQESYVFHPTTEKDTTQIFQRWCLLQDHKYNEQSKVTNRNGIYYFTSLQPGRFYLVLSESSYDENEVFRMIQEIHESSAFQGLDNQGNLDFQGRKLIRSIVEKHTTKEDSVISDLNNDIDDIKVDMKKNVRNVIMNNDKAEQLNQQSLEIKEGAGIFHNNAKELKKITCLQNWKLWIIIMIITIVILMVLIIPIASNNSEEDTTEKTDIVVNKEQSNSNTDVMDTMGNKVKSNQNVINPDASDTQQEKQAENDGVVVDSTSGGKQQEAGDNSTDNNTNEVEESSNSTEQQNEQKKETQDQSTENTGSTENTENTEQTTPQDNQQQPETTDSTQNDSQNQENPDNTPENTPANTPANTPDNTPDNTTSQTPTTNTDSDNNNNTDTTDIENRRFL